MAWPFNSSNTAEESAAVTSNCWLAEKCRVSPAGSSASSRVVPSASMRTRVAADVETARSKGTVGGEVDEFDVAGLAADGSTLAVADWVSAGKSAEEDDFFAERWAA